MGNVGKSSKGIAQNVTDSSREILFPEQTDELLKQLVLNKTRDITLVAGDNKAKYPVHRDVLSSSSEYFRTMFAGSFEESDKKKVTLRNVTGNALMEIVNYCYTGKINLNPDNVQALIEASTEYQFPKIVGVCSEYMTSLLCPENCIGFMEFSDLYDLNGLHTKSKQVLSRNFSAVTKGDEFKKVSVKRLKSILAMDELNVQSETEVVDAIKIWIDYDHNRKEHMYELFELVRLMLVDQEIIASLIKEMQGTATEGLMKKVVLWQSKRKPQAGQMTKRQLVVLEGQNEKKSVVEYYCCESQQWKYWKYIKRFGDHHKSVVWNNDIYFVCQFQHNEVYQYRVTSGAIKNVPTKTWFDMNSKVNLSLIAVDEGVNRGMYICMGEYAYRFNGKQWHRLTFEHNGKSRALAVNGEYVYRFLQKDGRSRMDKYHLKSFQPKWVNRSYTSVLRRDADLIALNDYIYVIGGVKDDDVLVKFVERYDMKDDSWTNLSDAPSAQFNRLCVCNGTIYGIFGKSDVYEYNENEDIWTKISSWNENRCRPQLLSLNLGVNANFT